jgi:hypothetical protein
MSNAVVLHGEAPRSGSQIVLVGPNEVRKTNGRLTEGEYIWTRYECSNFTLQSGTPEARAAAVSFLSARTSEQLGAVTSLYGYLSFAENHHFNGGTFAPVEEIRTWADRLRELSEELQKPGGFSAVSPPPSGLVWHPFVMKLGFWLLPKEDEPRGFLPVLVAPDLYTFLVHEIVTLAFSGRPLMFCGYCKGLRRESRRVDCLYCSDACRQRAHRDRRRREVSAASGRALHRTRSRSPDDASIWFHRLDTLTPFNQIQTNVP